MSLSCSSPSCLCYSRGSGLLHLRKATNAIVASLRVKKSLSTLIPPIPEFSEAMKIERFMSAIGGECDMGDARVIRECDEVQKRTVPPHIHRITLCPTHTSPCALLCPLGCVELDGDESRLLLTDYAQYEYSFSEYAVQVRAITVDRSPHKPLPLS